MQKKVLQLLWQRVVIQDLFGGSVVWFTGVQWPGVIEPIWQHDGGVAGEYIVKVGVVNDVQALLLLVPEGFTQHVFMPKPLRWDVNFITATAAMSKFPRHAYQDTDEDVEHHYEAENFYFAATHSHAASPRDLNTREEISF